MYQTLCKQMLLRLNNPVTDCLSPEQAGRCKGYTIVTQALGLRCNFLQFEGHPYVILLDIAKAHPSTPNPLLWETMYTLGVPPTMISILRPACKHTQCVVMANGQHHMYPQKGMLRRIAPSPVLFCVAYEWFHHTMAR